MRPEAARLEVVRSVAAGQWRRSQWQGKHEKKEKEKKMDEKETEKDKTRKKTGEESKEMVLVSNSEKLSPSAATKPKTVLGY